MQHSGQQWDFPNGWPPLQHLVVVGLEKTREPRAQALAFDLAQKWLTNNYNAYQQSMPKAMFEKVSLFPLVILKKKRNFHNFPFVLV